MKYVGKIVDSVVSVKERSENTMYKNLPYSSKHKIKLGHFNYPPKIRTIKEYQQKARYYPRKEDNND
jgi:hypothetical protein